MIGDVINRSLTSPTVRRLKRVVVVAFIAIILLATNPSLDEFKSYAMLRSDNPSGVVAARTSYWMLFSIYESKETNATGSERNTYVGVLHNFIRVGSR